MKGKHIENKMKNLIRIQDEKETDSHAAQGKKEMEKTR